MTNLTGAEVKVSHQIKSARLYCITCPPPAEMSYEKMVELACKGGADVIQFRDKKLSGRELVAAGRTLKKICSSYGVVFIVNDRLDVALACSADGVHLGQEDLPLAQARKIVDGLLTDGARLSKDFVIGCSTHSLEQAKRAQEEGADYIGCGPVYATPTKPDYRSVGLELVQRYRQEIKIPFVAIGGIDESNVGEVVRAGARCVAVVRAVCGKKSVEKSARAIRELIAKAYA